MPPGATPIFGELRQSGIQDFRAYLKDNPQGAIRCVRMIGTVYFNEAFMEVIEADDRDELTQGPMPHQPFGISARPGARGQAPGQFWCRPPSPTTPAS
jgi:hypothetical protein